MIAFSAATHLRWKVGLPVIAILAFAAWGLLTRTLTWLQVATCLPIAYGLVVFTIGAVAYRPRALKALPADDELPMVSILIPAHNEELVIGHTLDSLLKLDYPRFEVIVIDDHSSDATDVVLRGYPVKVVTRRNLPNRGKSEALNAGLEFATGDVICVFDADSQVEPNFLRLAVAPMVDNAEICGVQTQVRMYNRHQNLLTAAQDDEFALFNEILQVGRSVIGGASALGGNGQLTRRSAIRTVGGWSPQSLTEDLDLTMRLFLAGCGRIAHVSEAIVWQEGVTELPALIRQRTRWAEGMLRCFGDFATAVLKTPHLGWGTRVDAFYALASVFLPLLTVASIVYSACVALPGFFLATLPQAAATVISALTLAGVCGWSLTVSYKRDRKLDVMPGLRYMVYILHWVPAVIRAVDNVMRDTPVVWAKTEHRGHLLNAGPAREVAAEREALSA